MANPVDLEVEFDSGDDGEHASTPGPDAVELAVGRGNKASRTGRAAVAVAALAAAGGAGAAIGSRNPAGPPPQPAASAATTLVSTVPSAFAARPAAARAVVKIHTAAAPASPTNVRAVAVLADGRLARLDLDRGSAELVDLPIEVAPGTEVSLVAGQGWVLARPAGSADAAVVYDDTRAASVVSAALGGRATGVYDGGRDDAVWVAVDGSKPTSSYAQQVDLGGRTVGVSYPLNGVTPLGPDGTGELLVVSTGGTYVTGGGTYHLLTTGAVIAASAAHLVTTECNPDLTCRRALVGRASGARTDLGETPPHGAARAPGLVSPSGTKVALRTANGAGIELVDTTAGTAAPSSVVVVEASREPITGTAAGPVAWSADERSLVFLDRTTDHLAVYDTVTGTSRDVFTELPAIATLAFRAE